MVKLKKTIEEYMKELTLPAFAKPYRAAFAFALTLWFVGILTAFSNVASGQPNQLMLADILIALRSKKVTLPERNRILAEAVVVRGVTFALTPEIEKELEDTGADKNLIYSIRQKSHIVKISAVVTPPVEKKPKVEPAPPPPDFWFYEKRADTDLSKGEFDSALADYTKAIEMNPLSPQAFLGRGMAYANKQSYDLAVADYDKAIELKPKNSAAYENRAEALEKKGNKEMALADYDKAVEFEPSNESAKAGAARVRAEQAKLVQKPDPVVVAPPIVTAPPIPEFVDLGLLTKAAAVRMVTPVYPMFAAKANIGGRVVVDVTLDPEGKVTSAKANIGHPLLKQSGEEAALKSKFKPAMVGDQAVKAKGYIVYNFTPQH